MDIHASIPHLCIEQLELGSIFLLSATCKGLRSIVEAVLKADNGHAAKLQLVRAVKAAATGSLKESKFTDPLRPSLRQTRSAIEQQIKWLLKLSMNPTMLQQVAHELVHIHHVPAAVASALVAAGLRISWAQLLAASRAAVPGLDVWPRVYCQQRVEGHDMPEVGMMLCCGLRPEDSQLARLSPSELADLLHLLCACSPDKSVKQSFLSTWYDTPNDQVLQLVQLPAAQELDEAAVLGLLKAAVQLSAPQQLRQLSRLPAVQHLEPHAAAELLCLAAQQEQTTSRHSHHGLAALMLHLGVGQELFFDNEGFGGGGSFGALGSALMDKGSCISIIAHCIPAAKELQLGELQRVLCRAAGGCSATALRQLLRDLPAVQQLDAAAAAEVMAAAVAANDHANLKLLLGGIPAAKTISNEAVMQQLLAAAGSNDARLLQELCCMSQAAAAVSGDGLDQILAAACNPLRTSCCSSSSSRCCNAGTAMDLLCSFSKKVLQLRRFVATAGVNPNRFYQLVQACLQAGDAGYSATAEAGKAVEVLREHLQAAGNQLQYGKLHSLLELAVKQGNGRAVRALCTLRGVFEFSTAEVAGLMLTAAAATHYVADAVAALTGVHAAKAAPLDSLLQVLIADVSKGGLCNSCAGQLIALPAAQQLSTKVIAMTLPCYVLRKDWPSVAALLCLPAAADLEEEEVLKLLQLVLVKSQDGDRSALAVVCTQPVQQLRPRAVKQLLQFAACSSEPVHAALFKRISKLQQQKLL